MAEGHFVDTIDGYTLKMHRIKVKQKSKTARMGPVILMHGLAATSADYIVSGSNVAMRK